MTIVEALRTKSFLDDKSLKLIRGKGYSLLYHRDLAFLLEISEPAASLFELLESDALRQSLLQFAVRVLGNTTCLLVP